MLRPIRATPLETRFEPLGFDIIVKIGIRNNRNYGVDFMEKKDSRLLTEREASLYFGWSLYTMREIRKRGEIEFIQFNEQTIRYTVEMLENYKNRYLKQVA